MGVLYPGEVMLALEVYLQGCGPGCLSEEDVLESSALWIGQQGCVTGQPGCVMWFFGNGFPVLLGNKGAKQCSFFGPSG